MKDWIFVPFAIFVLITTFGFADSPSQALERQKEIQIERKLQSLTQKAQLAQVEDLSELEDWLTEIHRQLRTVSRVAQQKFAHSLKRVEGQLDRLKDKLFDEMK